jgi:hypothetical protein
VLERAHERQLSLNLFRPGVVSYTSETIIITGRAMCWNDVVLLSFVAADCTVRVPVFVDATDGATNSGAANSG